MRVRPEEGGTPPQRQGRQVHGMPGAVVFGSCESWGEEMGAPAWSRSSSSVGRSFPRPGPRIHTAPLGHRLPSARALSPRRGRARRRGRASSRSGQWGLSLEAGAWRPRRDARSGGCFKMADAAGPSRSEAAAFWTRDRILCPPARGRRRPPRGGEGRAVAWESQLRGDSCASPKGGGRALRPVQVRSFPLLGYQVSPGRNPRCRGAAQVLAGPEGFGQMPWSRDPAWDWEGPSAPLPGVTPS